MSIDAIENNTLVRDDANREGRVQVTRRERKLIADGKLVRVNVLFAGGSQEWWDLRYLTVVIREEPVFEDFENDE